MHEMPAFCAAFFALFLLSYFHSTAQEINKLCYFIIIKSKLIALPYREEGRGVRT